MDPAPTSQSLRSRFAHKAAADPEHIERIHAEIRQRQKADQEKAQLRREQHTSNMLLTHVLATRSEIAAFTDRLDKYDTATVEALMQNNTKLEQSREELQRMLQQAHVLPDGRRVFRTDDGQRVFDEHGREVGADVIAPSDVRHGSSTWEQFNAELQNRTRLQGDQSQLLDFQQRADRARERIQDGNVTRQELDDLAADLDRSMPVFVRETLDRRIGSGPASEQNEAPVKIGEELTIDQPLRERALDRSAPTVPAP